jgi:hypothetical protein
MCITRCTWQRARWSMSTDGTRRVWRRVWHLHTRLRQLSPPLPPASIPAAGSNSSPDPPPAGFTRLDGYPCRCTATLLAAPGPSHCRSLSLADSMCCPGAGARRWGSQSAHQWWGSLLALPVAGRRADLHAARRCKRGGRPTMQYGMASSTTWERGLAAQEWRAAGCARGDGEPLDLGAAVWWHKREGKPVAQEERMADGAIGGENLGFEIWERSGRDLGSWLFRWELDFRVSRVCSVIMTYGVHMS